MSYKPIYNVPILPKPSKEELERKEIEEAVREHSEKIKSLSAEVEALLRNEEEIAKHASKLASDKDREKRVEAIKSLFEELVAMDIGRVEQVLQREQLRLEIKKLAAEQDVGLQREQLRLEIQRLAAEQGEGGTVDNPAGQHEDAL